MVWQCFFPPQKTKQSIEYPTTTINDLNNDMLYKIFDYLDTKELFRVSHVCKRFKNIYNEKLKDKKPVNVSYLFFNSLKVS